MTAADMAALHALCFETPRPWSADDFTGLLRSPHVFALTKPGALLLARVVAGEAELLTLAVDPTLQGQGIGGQLLADFLNMAKTHHAESAFLEVAAANTTAQRLYARHGFSQSGLRRAYYRGPDGKTQDALLLARSL